MTADVGALGEGRGRDRSKFAIKIVVYIGRIKAESMAFMYWPLTTAWPVVKTRQELINQEAKECHC